MLPEADLRQSFYCILSNFQILFERLFACVGAQSLISPHLFYLSDYVTRTEDFQIGDRKKTSLPYESWISIMLITHNLKKYWNWNRIYKCVIQNLNETVVGPHVYRKEASPPLSLPPWPIPPHPNMNVDFMSQQTPPHHDVNFTPRPTPGTFLGITSLEFISNFQIGA